MISILNWLNYSLIFIFITISFFYHNYDYGWEIYFYREITIFASVLIFFIWFFKAYSRWRKLKILGSQNGFKITNQGWYKALFNEILPHFFYLIIIVLLLNFIENTMLFAGVICLLIMEGIIFLIKGKSKFKLVISQNSIIIVNNRPHFIFWDNVKNIVFQYNGLIISLKNNKQYFIDELDFINSNNWKEIFEKQAISKGIYVQN